MPSLLPLHDRVLMERSVTGFRERVMQASVVYALVVVLRRGRVHLHFAEFQTSLCRVYGYGLADCIPNAIRVFYYTSNTSALYPFELCHYFKIQLGLVKFEMIKLYVFGIAGFFHLDVKRSRRRL